MGYRIAGLAAAILAALIPTMTIASISVGFETDVNSRYVWRGLVQDESPVVQASVWGSVSDLEVAVWANWPTAKDAASARPNELDFTATYPLAWAGMDIEPAAAAYWYPG